MSERGPVIAIDGPTASGKGTISRGLAQKLGWHLLGSGALYRLVALVAAKQSISIDDPDRLAAAAAAMAVEFSAAGDAEKILLDRVDVDSPRRVTRGTLSSVGGGHKH